MAGTSQHGIKRSPGAARPATHDSSHAALEGSEKAERLRSRPFLTNSKPGPEKTRIHGENFIIAVLFMDISLDQKERCTHSICFPPGCETGHRKKQGTKPCPRRELRRTKLHETEPLLIYARVRFACSVSHNCPPCSMTWDDTLRL